MGTKWIEGNHTQHSLIYDTDEWKPLPEDRLTFIKFIFNSLKKILAVTETPTHYLILYDVFGLYN